MGDFLQTLSVERGRGMGVICTFGVFCGVIFGRGGLHQTLDFLRLVFFLLCVQLRFHVCGVVLKANVSTSCEILLITY